MSASPCVQYNSEPSVDAIEDDTTLHSIVEITCLKDGN